MVRHFGFVLAVVLSSCVGPVMDPPIIPGTGGGGGGGGDHSQGGGFAEGGGCGFGGLGGSFGGSGGGNDPLIVPAVPPPPISGGTLTVMADETVVAADPDRDEVWLLPAGSQTPLRVALQTGDEPGRVVEGPPGRAFVALRRAGRVAEVDLAAGSVVARHGACGAPRGMAWSRADQVLLVACATGDLARLAFVNGALASTTATHPVDDLRDVLIDSAGGALVTTFRPATVHRVDATGALVGPLAGPPVTSGAARVAWRTVSTARGAVMLYQQSQTTPLMASVCSPGYGSTFGDARPVEPSVARLDGTGGEMLGSLGAVLTLVVDVAATADGQHLAVAAPGSGMVAMIDTADASATRIMSGIGQPIAVAFRGSTLIVQSREPAALYIVGAFTQQIALSTVSRRSTGHDLFHVATTANVACASCHPEAGDDGHVWQLPEGTRRTPVLRGGLAATAPFHWDGAMTTMGTLVSEVMVKRMGGAPQSPERVQALTDWLDGVPRLPAPTVDAAAVGRGEVLFRDSACTACHAGPLGTNNQTVSVGTGVALQVPRLTELAGREPYFHDGRVPSLEARFTAVGGSAHGDTSRLTPAQIDDLVAYLRTR